MFCVVLCETETVSTCLPGDRPQEAPQPQLIWADSSADSPGALGAAQPVPRVLALTCCQLQD